MKCTVILDKTREEEIVIYAHQKNEMIFEIERMAQEKPLQLTGFLNEEIVKSYKAATSKKEVITMNYDFTAEKYLIKARLYNIEEILDKSFIKINQSSIANVKKIQKFDASISGTLKVIFKNGHTDYVSRRNIKNVKERLGL